MAHISNKFEYTLNINEVIQLQVRQALYYLIQNNPAKVKNSIAFMPLLLRKELDLVTIDYLVSGPTHVTFYSNITITYSGDNQEIITAIQDFEAEQTKTDENNGQ